MFGLCSIRAYLLFMWFRVLMFRDVVGCKVRSFRCRVFCGVFRGLKMFGREGSGGFV